MITNERVDELIAWTMGRDTKECLAELKTWRAMRPKLLECLYGAKEEFIIAGRADGAKSIDSLIAELDKQ